MRLYRLAEGANAEGYPYLLDGHAYLADGTPLTERDRLGRVVPAWGTLSLSKATSSGGILGLAERRRGLEALARALDARDFVRAPLVLLHLQIDPANLVAKYNPFHKPSGPGGGQFTNALGAAGLPTQSSHLQEVAQSLHVAVNSTWVNGIYGPEMDKAHADALMLVRVATAIVGKIDFRPGMPGYGQILDQTLANLVEDLHFPNFFVKPVYLGRELYKGPGYPPGSSVPDLVYGPKDHPLIIFELKTGRAARNISDAEIAEQKRRTLMNAPDDPVYQYFQVYDQ
jgi:hypothetical protein